MPATMTSHCVPLAISIPAPASSAAFAGSTPISFTSNLITGAQPAKNENPEMSNEEKLNVVGMNVLKQNGANVDEIVRLLVYNASVEFTAYYYFTNLRAHCVGLDGEGIKGVIEDARMEDLSHFESCIQRIYELGDTLPNDAIEFVRMSGCEFLQLPTPATNLKEILKKCLAAEQGAIVNWNKLCNLTIGKDPATYDIAKDILKEEIEHEAWFLELIHGRPSGHMRRKYAGERPHTHKHSRALSQL